MINEHTIGAEYPYPEDIEARITRLQDPFFGEIYTSAMEDYRWWGEPNQYEGNFHQQLSRRREMKRAYHRFPMTEFIETLGFPGQKESWQIASREDVEGHTFTAYPPGVEPPRMESNVDNLNHSEERRIQIETQYVDHKIRQWGSFGNQLEEEHAEAVADWVAKTRQINEPYLRGEHIVPDVTTKLRQPVDPRVLPASPYTEFDQVAVDSIFAPKQVLGDLNVLEQARAPLSAAHRVVDAYQAGHDTSHLDRPTNFANQFVLKTAYQRALFTHHVACIIAKEKKVAAPPAPLPDPRLARNDVLDARRQYSKIVATIVELQQLPPASDALATQQYYAKVAAFITTGIDKGFLPSDTSLLPLPFQEALRKLHQSSFISTRADELKAVEEGRELTKKLAVEARENPDAFTAPPVHWNTEFDPPVQEKPRVIESWEKPESYVVTAKDAADALKVSEPVAQDIFTSARPDWLSHRLFELKSLGRLSEAELLAQQYDQVAKTHEQYLIAHPLPDAPTTPDVDAIHAYERAMATALEEREQQWRETLSTLLKLPRNGTAPIFATVADSTIIDSFSGFNILKTPTSVNILGPPPELGPIKLEHTTNWGEKLAKSAEERRFIFQKEYVEFLHKDAACLLTLDEVKAFAERHAQMLKNDGDVSLASARARFIDLYRPYSTFTQDDIIARYGEMVAMQGSGQLVDRAQRTRRADATIQSFNEYWARRRASLPSTSTTASTLPEFKTTRQLLNEQRTRMAEKKNALFERILASTPQQINALVTSYMQRQQDRMMTAEILTAMRDMKIIETDPEFKHLRMTDRWTPSVHQPHGRVLESFFKVIAPIVFYGFTKPRLWLNMKLYKFWNWATGNTPEMHARIRRFLNLDILEPKYMSYPRLDPAKAYLDQSYYKEIYYRLHHFFNPPQGMTPIQGLRATEPSIPTWWELTVRNWRRRMLVRLEAATLGARFWFFPALGLTAISTYALLEQRKTLAHDLLRTKPEGLEWNMKRRRKFLQRAEMLAPLQLRRPHAGPAAKWYGWNEEPYDQNMAYLHRANSSNARDWQGIE